MYDCSLYFRACGGKHFPYNASFAGYYLHNTGNALLAAGSWIMWLYIL